jgi:hypothetical protein
MPPRWRIGRLAIVTAFARGHGVVNRTSVIAARSTAYPASQHFRAPRHDSTKVEEASPNSR